MSISRNVQVGIFLVSGVVLAGAGLFSIGNHKQIFTRHFEIYTEFANVSELQKGARIRVSGMDAGQLVEMQVPDQPSGRFRLKLQIDAKLHALVRQNSVASIATEGLVGDKYLEISKGSEQSPESAAGSTIPSKESFDLSALIDQGNELLKTTRSSIDDIRGQADRALESFTKVGNDADSTIVSMRGEFKQITDQALRVTDSVNQIVAGIQDGQGTVGKLLKDETLWAKIDDTTKNLDEASGKVNNVLSDFEKRDLLGQAQATLENTRQITEKLNQAVTTFLDNQKGGKDTAAALRDVVAEAKLTMTNLGDDTEAIKHNFLLRGFFKRRGYYDLSELTPATYMTSKFVKSNSSERVWLPGTDLFAGQQDGKEDLTAAGEAALNRCMETLVKQLPNKTIVVEGYSSYGTADQRYIRSRRRAEMVKKYLENEFELKAGMTGVMPLGDSPPTATGKTVWDGISIVMLE